MAELTAKDPKGAQKATAAASPIRRDDWIHGLWQNKIALVALVVFISLVLMAILGPILYPVNPAATDLFARFAPPVFIDGSSGHPLGADYLGRDVLARVMSGAQISLLVGLSVVVVAGLVGTLLGLIAGYRGGWIDTLIMRFADAQLAFPGLVVVLLVLAVFGPSLGLIIGVLSFFGWVIYGRLVRALVLQLRETPAIQAANLVGCSLPRIMFKHLLPNLYAPLLVQSMLELARMMLAEASLSYLGLGLQPPAASWGLMVAENQGDISLAWWAVVFPGVALTLTILSINVISNFIRVQTDPQLRDRRFAASSLMKSTSSWLNQRQGRSLTSNQSGSESVQRREGPAPLLRVEDVDVRFYTSSGTVDAVRQMNFDISPGETVGIVGESGSGKSSAGLALLDLIGPPGRVEGARIIWRGEVLTPERLHKLRGSDIAMIFQDPMTSLNPLVSVGRQIAEVARKHKGMSRADAWKRAEELLVLVGIPSPHERLRQFPHQLSGGLRQRVMIAAALASDPKLIIADEPTTALDATIQAQILDLIEELQTKLGVALLLISHDLGVVARVCDRVIVMYDGRIVEEGSVFDVFATPKHRYTEALLNAIPGSGDQRGKLAAIPGRPPRRGDAVTGCPFAPRCAFATDICRSEMPPLVDGPSGRFACWHPAGGAS